MPATLLLLALLDAPAPSTSVVRALPLASLTAAQAERLQGRRLRFVVELDSPATLLAGQPCYQVRSDRGDVNAGVRLCADQEVGADEVAVVVEGTLTVRRFAPWRDVPAFWQVEVREVRDAVRVP